MQAGTDREWIEASCRGDRAAFAHLIARYQRPVYAVAYSATRDRALADDVTQDAFVTAWRRLGELRDPDRVGAWLCGIARNVARDARKRVRGEVRVDLEIAGGATPYDEVTEAEHERIIAAALDGVPEVYREPLVLFYYEERSLDEVARYLGLSPATTYKRLSRGRQQLAECVAAIVERGIPRRGPRATLAASVLAIIGVTLPASHVDASSAHKGPKGSTMYKLPLVASIAALAAVGGVAVVTTARSHAAEASPSPHESAPPAVADHAQRTPRAPAPGSTHSAAAAPALPALLHSHRTHATAAGPSDCTTVGNHLADLESATGAHGDAARCAADYTAACEREGWSIDRRACVVAADDVINAQLCAVELSDGAPDDAVIPASLACSVIAPHITPIVQGAGYYTDVPDFAQQVEDACDTGAWSLAFRQCVAAAATWDALHACIQP
jgi:RNA polymerase sigma factor (sigma-70 family)